MTLTSTGVELDEFDRRLWDIIDERIATLGPIYVPLLEGSLPKERLAHWAGQLYVENRPFVQVLGGILTECDDRVAQAFLADDLFDETGRGEPERNHLSIVGRFAVACGHPPDELDRIRATAATAELIDYYLSLRDVPWVESLAAVGIGLEGSFLARPEREVDSTTAAMAASALQEHYGFSDDAVEFFLLHDVTDVEHTRRAMDIVRRHVSTDAQRRAVVRRVEEMAEQVTGWAATTFQEAVATP